MSRFATMNNTVIKILKPDDMHVHLRQGPELHGYAGDCVPYFKKILVMPNTDPAIQDAGALRAYQQRIQDAAPELQALMTFKLTPALSCDQVSALIKAGAVAGKLYPAGVTTGSEDGVGDVRTVFPHLEIMQQHDSVLSIHGEDPESFCLDRERNYLKQVQSIRDAFPKLRMVLEHLSDKASVDFVENGGDGMAATISVHHLLLTLDDVIGGRVNPHHFCKPVAKFPADRDAVRRAAFSGNPKFFLGTDSAPHPKKQKESSAGCAGIYTSPVAVPLLTQIFDRAGVLNNLEGFCSRNGSRFYGLPLNRETIVLEKNEWTVPDIMHGVVPFYAGETISWSLANGRNQHAGIS